MPQLDLFSAKHILPTPEMETQIVEKLEERGRSRAPVQSHLCDPDEKQVGNLQCDVNMSADGGCDLTCQALCCLCCVNIGDLRVSKVIQRIACCRLMLFAVCSVCLYYVSFYLVCTDAVC